MHSFLAYFWTCCCCLLGWLPFIFHGAKHLSMQARQARILYFKIWSLVQYILVNFWSCCCCPLGWVPFLFHGAKYLSMQATRAIITFQNIISSALFSSLFLDLLILLFGLGSFYFMVQSTSQRKQQKLEKYFKIFALVQCALVYFWSCCYCALNWAPFYFMVQNTS